MNCIYLIVSGNAKRQPINENSNLNIKSMTPKPPKLLIDGDQCLVIGGVHSGKFGIVRDINKSKTGHITITVEQKNGVRFKTLGKNVSVQQTIK